MKKQKKNSLTAYNKKPDIDEVVKLVESYTKSFNNTVKERLEYYRNDNILWARNLFNKCQKLFEEFFGEPLRSIGNADQDTLNYLLFSFYLPIQEEALTLATSKEKGVVYEIFNNRLITSSPSELTLNDEVVDMFIRYKLSPFATLMFFYEKLASEAWKGIFETARFFNKAENQKSLQMQIDSIDTKEETYYLNEFKKYRTNKLKSGEKLTFTNFAQYIGQPRTTLKDKYKRLGIYEQIKKQIS